MTNQNNDREELVKEYNFIKPFKKQLLDIGLYWEIAERLDDFIQSYTQKKVEEALKNILEENHCDLDGTYDYDGIAETVIKLCKNK